MADNKYGHIFTENDVLAIIQYVAECNEDEAADMLAEVLDDAKLRLKFDRKEPLFILRGRDKRAAGAIMHYRDHQARTAPDNHVEAIGKALQAFNDYRQDNPGQMKEPD